MSKQKSLGNGITAVVIIFGIALMAVLFAMVNRNSNTDPSVAQAEKPTATDSQPTRIAVPALPPGHVLVGGVQRPASDVNLGKDAEKPTTKAPPKKPHGFSPPVAPDSNEQTKLVAQSLKDKAKPERFSSFVVPQDFDQAAFKADPKGYAAQYASDVAPGRVFAPAQPGEGVAPIKANSARFHRVKQGESLRLSVKAAPSAPVTFWSQNLGTFDNKLSSVTVVSDESGVASANFTVGGGTVDQVNVLAASPVTSGQANFIVAVSVPGQL